MSGALRFILIASIPAAVAMALAGRPLISILEGGALDAESADRVFRVLQFFALGIVTQSAVEIRARAFYADKDPMAALWIALIVAVINLGLAITLSNLYNVPGLALANSLAAGCELLLLVVILRRRWQGIDGVALLQTTAKALAAAAIMGVGILAAGAGLRLFPVGTSRTAFIWFAVLPTALPPRAHPFPPPPLAPHPPPPLPT